LIAPVAASALAEMRAAASAVAASQTFTVDLNGLTVLDSPIIAALIATLRDLREHGAELVLVTDRPAILQTLHVTALDRVFDVEAPTTELEPGPAVPPKPPATPKKARRRHRLATSAVAMGLLIAGVAMPGAAQATPSPDGIVERIVAANPSLLSYQSRVHVAVRMQSFPFLAPRLEGTTYFKRPDNFEVVFDRVPSYAKGFDRLYADIGDPTSWPRRFNMSLAGDRSVNGHSDVVMRLVQKVRGMIDHEDVAVDPSSWRIDEMEWHYYNGGIITMKQSFERSGAWTVLASQHAVIRIPYVRAVADATYDDYRTNVAIADGVFTKNKAK
jgi:anti-anti-sigma factor